MPELQSHPPPTQREWAANLKIRAGARRQALAARDYSTFVLLHDSHEKIDALMAVGEHIGALEILGCASRSMLDGASRGVEPNLTARDAATWWRLVADVWRTRNNPPVWRWEDVWCEVFASEVPGHQHMMTPIERRALAAMPDRFQIWRGVRHPDAFEYECPMSWTLDRAQAEWFAAVQGMGVPGSGYGAGDPLVGSAWINREHVLAYFGGREQEVVAYGDALEDVDVRTVPRVRIGRA